MFDLLVIEGSFVDARVDVGNKISLPSSRSARAGPFHLWGPLPILAAFPP
jgi:hypothetical protein